MLEGFEYTLFDDISKPYLFINSEDLVELISKIFDSWNEQTEILNIYNPFEITFQHVAEKLEELAFSNSKIVIDSKSPEPCLYYSTR